MSDNTEQILDNAAEHVAETNRIVDQHVLPVAMLPKGRKKKVELSEAIELPKFLPRSVVIQIKGLSPLIINNFSQKAITQMLDKQMGKAKVGKEPKDPIKEFRCSLYPKVN